MRSSAKPGSIAGQFPRSPPTEAPDLDAAFTSLLATLDETVVPGLTQVQHPMYFGWFPSNASLSSVLGDIASSGIGALGISWESAPALTEVEEVVCDWLRQWVGLSEAWKGTIHDTASTACLCALILARESACSLQATRQGLTTLGQPLVVFCSAQAHSSVKKAAALAGFGLDNIEIVNHDPGDYSMSPEDLLARVRSCRERGASPAAVIATVGTTATTAMDPVEDIAKICQKEGIWLHVDAAMAGSAMILPECRNLWHGVEGADSLCWNPHKWLGTILDTSVFYVRDVQHMVRVMGTHPTYLHSRADGQVTQYRDWGIPLGRRFRALKVLFQLSLEGTDAIEARIRRDLRYAQSFKERVEAAPGWTLVAPVALQTVCVVYVPPQSNEQEVEANNFTRRWLEAVNASGRAYLTGTRLDGRWIVRVSFGAHTTQELHVDRLWELLNRAVRETPLKDDGSLA